MVDGKKTKKIMYLAFLVRDPSSCRWRTKGSRFDTTINGPLISGFLFTPASENGSEKHYEDQSDISKVENQEVRLISGIHRDLLLK